MGCMRVRGLLLSIICTALALGCGGTQDHHAAPSLSQSQALELAIAIANEACMSKFSMAPFDNSSSTIEFKGGRWYWGGLDLAGHAGLSASVSFDEQGNDRRVDVYLSTDKLQGTYK